jgi:AcrR family transcriptional regulator
LSRSAASSRLPAEQRRRQLLSTARAVFADRGFHGASMDDVADAAGVTKPVLYQHFRSKRALFNEVLADIGDQLLERFQRSTAAASGPRDTVESGFVAYFRFLDAHPDAFRLLFGAPVRHDPDFGEVAELVVERLAGAVVPLVEIDGPPEQRVVLAHALVGMAESVGRWMLAESGVVRPAVPAEQLAEWVLELAWFGLRGQRHAVPSLPSPVTRIPPERAGRPGRPGPAGRPGRKAASA